MYFNSGRMKALLAQKGTFLTTIAPTNSNANPIERDFASIRGFLKRYPGTYDSWNTLYTLCTWLNLFCNTQLIDGQKITPWELHYGVKPYFARILKSSIPDRDYKPKQSSVNISKWLKLHNDRSQAAKKSPAHNFKIGEMVLYKKGGTKDPTLLPAKVVSLGPDTCNIKNKAGLILTRLYRDVIKK